MQFIDVKCDREGRPVPVSPCKPNKLGLKDGNLDEPGGEKSVYSFLDKFYVLHEVIGKGGFSTVRRATHVHTGEVVAVKMVDKRSTAIKELVVKTAIDQELRLLKSLEHPNLCKLFQEIHSSQFICMVQEYYPGGELFHYVQSKERLGEPEARRIFRQIASGLAYLHENGVCHRDLKLENVLLDSSLNAKLIDFGLCAVCEESEDTPLSMFCGSPTYAAPELVACKPYIGFKTDIWSLGVVLYCCLNGFFPFYSADYTELYTLIKAGKYDEPDWLSQDSKAIIRQLLQTDPVTRPTVKEVLEHPWCCSGTAERLVPKEKATTQDLCDTVQKTTGLRCTKLEQKPFNSEILTKMAEFYGSSEESLKNQLSQWDFSSYLTSVYLILLERKRKYGNKIFKIFGVQIPMVNNNCKAITISTGGTNLNKTKTDSNQSASECGGGDTSKTEHLNPYASKSTPPDVQARCAKPVAIIECPDAMVIRKGTKNVSSNGTKHFSVIQLAHRISGAFGRNKNDTGDTSINVPLPGIIDPTVAMTLMKAAFHIQGVKYTQNGQSLSGTILRISSTSSSSKPECVVKFEVEVQVPQFIAKPLGPVHLHWKKLQGSTNFLRRATDVIASSIKTMTPEKLIFTHNVS